MSDSQFVDVDLGNDNSVYGGTGLVERHLVARDGSFYPLRRVAAAYGSVFGFVSLFVSQDSATRNIPDRGPSKRKSSTVFGNAC